MNAPAIALTIAGSDPSGGAGIQADLKTFHQLSVYGTSVITLVTVQNTLGVRRVEVLNPELVEEQIDAVLEDLPPAAVKTGALGSAAIIENILRRDFAVPLVVDPVMLSSSGHDLLDPSGRSALNRLISRATLVTPNLAEASVLANIEVSGTAQMREAARRISHNGALSVLVKGGHLKGDAVDILLHRGAFFEFGGPRIETRHTHGTGCTYSAAITAHLALGLDLPPAIGEAWKFVRDAIAQAPGIGKGQGPLNHWV